MNRPSCLSLSLTALLSFRRRYKGVFGDEEAEDRDAKRWCGLRVKSHTRVEDYPVLADLSMEEAGLSKAAANKRVEEKNVLQAARKRGIQVEREISRERGSVP